MKKIIYGAILFLLFPVLSFSQKATWQVTSDGRSIFTDKEISHPDSHATQKNTGNNEMISHYPGSGKIYYIRNSEPWGQNSNLQLLDQAYGPGNYTASDYYVAPATVFNESTSIVILEGSDYNASALTVFLKHYITGIEEWVNAGGHLFLNAAPNQGSNIDFGFGGTVLQYTAFSSTGTMEARAAGHPIFNGPFGPVGTSWSGNYFSHGAIAGGPSIPLIMGTAGTILSELHWGSGIVLFGGMTTANFHLPQPDANNLRANIFAYLDSGLVSCAPPSHLRVRNVEATGAKLTWDLPEESVKGFQILYKVQNGGNTWEYARVDADVNHVIPSNLTPNTTYQWAMRSICGNNVSKSVIVPGPVFTTAPAADNIKVFPNPVKDLMEVDGLSVTQSTKLTIIDFKGNILLMATVTGKTYNWNVSSLKQGNYLLKIETGNMAISRWFVKE